MIKLILSFFFGCIFSGYLISQDSGLLGIIETEKWLQETFLKLYDTEESVYRDSLNNEIIARFENILKTEETFYYPWNGLKMIGKVQSQDNKMKIFSWHIRKSEKEYNYFGILQSYIKKGNKERIVVYVLNDKSDELKNPEILDLSPENWYGSLYYGIRTFTHKKKTCYALLGYDFNDTFSNKKLIDVLKFDKKGTPSFGGTFQMEFQKLKRVIYEYSSQVVMTIRYDERLKMIVIDHLSPIEPIFSNNYRFYSPDGSYDGFKFNKGVFILVPDVDARNN